MTGENRALVAMACEQISQTHKPGLVHLLKAASIRGDVDTTAIGYYLAPMINAACRLGRPEVALQLLLENRPPKAKELAGQLKMLNDDRKCYQEELLGQVLDILPDNLDEFPV